MACNRSHPRETLYVEEKSVTDSPMLIKLHRGITETQIKRKITKLMMKTCQPQPKLVNNAACAKWLKFNHESEVQVYREITKFQIRFDSKPFLCMIARKIDVSCAKWLFYRNFSAHYVANDSDATTVWLFSRELRFALFTGFSEGLTRLHSVTTAGREMIQKASILSC